MSQLPPIALKIVRPNPTSFILLEPIIRRDELPPYCVHGEVQCGACNRWCWLGSKTHDVVIKGIATPLCIDCARQHIPAGATPRRRVDDREGH